MFRQFSPGFGALNQPIISSQNALGTDVHLIQGSDVEAEAIDWLWTTFFPRKKVTTLAGQGSTGKTTFMMYVAATISQDYGRWPDGTPAPCGNVVIYSSEDGISDTLTPRLKANNAELSRIYFVDDASENGRRRPFSG